jgi:hypothetical protein
MSGKQTMTVKQKAYSGPFFWLSLTSFVIPLAVAGWAFRTLPEPYTYPVVTPDASGVDQQLWGFLLRTYVADGLIDYEGLRRNHLLKTYLAQLAAAEPDKLPDDAHRLALYCNAYNALVINGVLIHHIEASVLDYPSAKGQSTAGQGFFDVSEHLLANQTLSLNFLEHQIIRQQDQAEKTFEEPRIHMALVCAAKSCPPLRPEAYTGTRLERQLQDQARRFANQSAYVRYDATEQRLYLSPILKWYAADFGGETGVLDFLFPLIESPTTQAGVRAAREGQAQIVYNAYDWSLNTQGKTVGVNRSSGFGSGSIPNE